MPNPVSIVYLPNPSFKGSQAFYANIRAWRTRYPLILFSEHQWDADTVLLKTSPELVLGPTERRHAMSNLVWLTALRILRGREFTHFCYVEQDCRVAGHEWDGKVFDEALREPVPQIAGSVVCHSMCTVSMEWTRLWTQFIARHRHVTFPIPCIGGVGIAEAGIPCMFVNGALGIYDLALMLEFFEPQLKDGRTAKAAVEMPAWDVAVGRHLYDRYKEGIFDGRIRHLDTIFSGYGEVQSTEAERLEWLATGRCVAAHQIKSNANGPLTESDLRKEVMKTERLERHDLSRARAESGATGSDASGGAEVTGGAISEENTRTILEADGSVEKSQNILSQSQDESRGARLIAEVASGPSASIPPSMDIFIVSFKKDADWLWYCLKSIRRFCSGFSTVVIATPLHEQSDFAKHRAEFSGRNFRWKSYKEALPPLANLDHMLRKCSADEFCKAELIAHVDSDCVFFKPTTPADYMVNGKPVLPIEPFSVLVEKHPGRAHWKTGVDAALGGDHKFETMVRHPAVHWRTLYPLVRGHIEELHKKPFKDYVFSCKADYPQGFPEFPVMGAYALASASMRERYHFIDVSAEARPANHLAQGHSHPKGDPTNMDTEYEHIYQPDFPGITSHNQLVKHLEL